MPTRHVLDWLMACLLMTGCAAPPGVSETPASVFSVAAEGDGDELTLSVEGQATVIDVHSRSGIGSAVIKLVSGPSPENVVVRLHLKGLEEFRLSYAEATITASVSSGDRRSVFQRVAWPDGGERPVTRDSPFWLDVQIVSDQVPPRIPLEQGYFEITLPRSFLREEQRSFSIQWIDFYR